MKKIIIVVFVFLLSACKSQPPFDSSIQFTSDLQQFENLSKLKESLKDVEIIALGENTHGLGSVFDAKTDLVRFLHQELGFNLVLFESGFGDGALAWEQWDALSPQEFTTSFSSNFYYHSEEIQALAAYAKTQDNSIAIKGFDCQPQQNYLIKQMTEIAAPLDSTLANVVPLEMRSFNKLYQHENDKDSLAFGKQRDQFISFITNYDQFLEKNQQKLLGLGTKQGVIDAIKKSIQIFKNTYSNIVMGEIMGWPAAYNIRDKALFETVKWFKEQDPQTKIIIWAQNSHIENKTKPNYNVNWMGHSLKNLYGDKYYSIGAVVYSGKNLNYNGPFDFEHNDKEYLAYHLNQFQKDNFVLDLRKHNQNDFTQQLLTGMENNGNMTKFVAKDRFDGLLFLKHSDIPKLIKKE